MKPATEWAPPVHAGGPACKAALRVRNGKAVIGAGTPQGWQLKEAAN
jgi:hypothetical protein